MLGLSLSIPAVATRAKGVGYKFADTDAASFVARMTVAPSRDQKAIYDYFAVQAKAIGIWPYIIDCGFLGAHSFQAMLLGFKNVINLTQPQGATLHSRISGQGWSGNGVRYLATGYAFPAGRQNDASIGIYSLSPEGADFPDIGNETATIFCRHATLAKTLTRVNEVTSRQTDSVSGTGFFLANRLASTAADSTMWKFGAKQTSTVGDVSSAPVAPEIYIGARNFGATQYSNRLLAFWHIGTGIPEALIPGYQDLVEYCCAMLAACESSLPTLTRQTRSLYRTLNKYSRRKEYLIGAFDQYNWPLPPASPETGTPDLITDFATLTSGKVPAVKQFEYQDASVVGQPQVDTIIAKIKTHYAAGGIIWMCDHVGNPVTGSFYVEPTPQTPLTTGSMYDLTGNALINCLAGGSRRTEFLAYADRMSSWFNNLKTDAGELIPVVFRPFHEADDVWGWWMANSSDGPSFVQLWRDFVDRFRANGVRNVLFDFNRRMYTAPNTAYFPGQTYVDLITGDWYDDDPTTANVLGLTEGQPATAFAALVSIPNGYFKPRFFPELGYRYASQSNSGLWNTQTGFYHRDRFLNSAGFSLWRSPFGPKAGMTNAADFAAMVADPFCHTLDRVSGVYTATEALAA